MFAKGKKYFVKSATDYFVGECAKGAHDALLTKCSWVASTGRFHEAMASGVFDEAEPYPPKWVVTVHEGAIVSSCEWPHKLPVEAK